MFDIKKIRMRSGMTQDDLAKKMGVTQGAVSQWEKGDTVPSTDKLTELAKILNCSVDELLKPLV